MHTFTHIRENNRKLTDDVSIAISDACQVLQCVKNSYCSVGQNAERGKYNLQYSKKGRFVPHFHGMKYNKREK